AAGESNAVDTQPKNMNSLRPFTASLAFLILPLLLVAAQNPAAESSGTITGRVQNVVSGQYLNNARVSVKGTDLIAFTDQSGTYRLVNVPPGPVELEF